MSGTKEEKKLTSYAYALRFWRMFLSLSWNSRGYVLLLLAGICMAGSLAIYTYLPQTPSPNYTGFQQRMLELSSALFLIFLFLTHTSCLFISPRWIKPKTKGD